MSQKCKAKTEVWSRVCGFFRPVKQWNRGKRQEYQDRTPYKIAAREDAKDAKKGQKQ